MTPQPDWLTSLPGAVRGWPLAQVHPLRLRVTLPAAPYGRIKPNSPAEVMPEKPTEKHHAANVAGIDKPVDAANRRQPAKAPGQLARHARQRRGISRPRSSSTGHHRRWT